MVLYLNRCDILLGGSLLELLIFTAHNSGLLMQCGGVINLSCGGGRWASTALSYYFKTVHSG